MIQSTTTNHCTFCMDITSAFLACRCQHTDCRQQLRTASAIHFYSHSWTCTKWYDRDGHSNHVVWLFSNILEHNDIRPFTQPFVPDGQPFQQFPQTHRSSRDTCLRCDRNKCSPIRLRACISICDRLRAMTE